MAITIVAEYFGGLRGGQGVVLEDALASAYLSNPQLLARRAQGRAMNESMPQALANWRPTLKLDLKGERGYYESSNSTPSTQIRTPRSGNVVITQPLYRGGRTVTATRQSDAGIRADWSELLNVEQTVLGEATQAYLDVVRDTTMLDLNINNEQVLQRQLEATRDRFHVGEVTRTDVAQAEARLARATAIRLGAEGALQANRATYEQVIGTAPGTLTLPSTPPNLPRSLQETVEAAVVANPLVKTAEYIEEAARYGIDLVRGELRPTVNLEGTLSRGWDQMFRSSQTGTVDILLTVNVPLYQRGVTYSRLREAKHAAGQRRLESDQVRRTAIKLATQAWENVQSARAQIESFQTQITAAEVALEGVRYESQVGSRTVLDVLNAEQELVDARVALVQAKRNTLLAEYQLLAAVGRMTAKDLSLTVEIYDPSVHARAVQNKWFGSSVEAERDAELSDQLRHP